MLRLSFIAERRKGLRPLRKSRRERGLNLNAGLSVEQPCYEVAQWRRRKMQRLGGLVGGCWCEVGTGLGYGKKGRCRNDFLTPRKLLPFKFVLSFFFKSQNNSKPLLSEMEHIV